MIPYKHKQHQKESIKQYHTDKNDITKAFSPHSTHFPISENRENGCNLSPCTQILNSRSVQSPPVFGQSKNHACHLAVILLARRNAVSFQVPVIDSILYRTYPRAIPFSPINFFRAEFPHNVGTDMVCPFFTAGFAQYPISVPIYIR